MKRISGIGLTAVLLLAVMAGCGIIAPNVSASPGASASAGSEVPAGPVTVISREEGSGTRGAFIELMGIVKKDVDGKKNRLHDRFG